MINDSITTLEIITHGNKKHLPEPFMMYIVETNDPVEKSNRIKFSHDVLDRYEILYYQDLGVNYGISRCLSEWIWRFFYKNPDIPMYEKKLDTMKYILISTDILKYADILEEDQFMESVIWFFSDNVDMIDNIKFVYPECDIKINKILNEKNTIWHKIKYSSCFSPAFNGTGCTII